MSLPSLSLRGMGGVMLILVLAIGLVGCFENVLGPEAPLTGGEPVAGGDPVTGGEQPGEPGTGGPTGPGGPGGGDDPPPGSDPPPGGDPPGGDPPPPAEPPPSAGEVDPPGMIDPRFGKMKTGGYWDQFWTGSTSGLTEDGAGNGVNRERNSTLRAVCSIAGSEEADRFLNRGRIRFRVKVNADGLELGGGGKHLVNLASTPLCRGRRDLTRLTRVEIARPGDSHPRFILHNYVDGEGGARTLGDLPFRFEPDTWVDVDWSWELDGRSLTMICNGRTYHTTLLEGSEGVGRYWGSGHVETNSGGGSFTFGPAEVSRN